MIGVIGCWVRGWGWRHGIGAIAVGITRIGYNLWELLLYVEAHPNRMAACAAAAEQTASEA